MYSHCHICNIPIYFFNIHMKHLQHASETPKTLETYTYNMRFQAQHLLAACTKWRIIDIELDAAEWRGGWRWQWAGDRMAPDEHLCGCDNRAAGSGPRGGGGCATRDERPPHDGEGRDGQMAQWRMPQRVRRNGNR
jgi:hypothetical protein